GHLLAGCPWLASHPFVVGRKRDLPRRSRLAHQRNKYSVPKSSALHQRLLLHYGFRIQSALRVLCWEQGGSHTPGNHTRLQTSWSPAAEQRCAADHRPSPQPASNQAGMEYPPELRKFLRPARAFEDASLKLSRNELSPHAKPVQQSSLLWLHNASSTLQPAAAMALYRRPPLSCH